MSETVRKDVLKPLGMKLAVDASRLNDVGRGRRGISADTALLKRIQAEITPKVA